MVDKVKLLKFLRDEKRICWLEIYLKIFTASETPIRCLECDEYFTMSQAGMCFYHPGRSEYSFVTRRRHFQCCEYDFVFGDALQLEDQA